LKAKAFDIRAMENHVAAGKATMTKRWVPSHAPVPALRAVQGLAGPAAP
jgi:hypothetical protein